MMKKSTLLLLLFTGWYAGIVAQKARPATIYGQIKSDKDTVNLIVWLAENPIVGYGEEMTKITAAVKPDGTFSFTTPPIEHFARIEILDGNTGNYLCYLKQQFIAPGDSIQMTATLQDKAASKFLKASFSGKGSEKFECMQAMQPESFWYASVDTKINAENAVRVYDSIMTSKQAVLKKYRSKLSKAEYDLMLTDISSEFKIKMLWHTCGVRPGSVLANIPTADQLTVQKKAFAELMAHFNDAAVDNKIAGLSFSYRVYLLHKSKVQQVFENSGQLVTLLQLFNRLQKQYTGALRDQLLGSLLLNPSENSMYFGGVDPEDYMTCLRTTNSVVQSGELQRRLQQVLASKVKGVPAFNFSLPVDSSDKKMSLSELKGKVVLLDLWSYSCGGCILFTNAFHKKIFPLFQNNPDFAVVSIMLDSYAGKEKYMHRLRNGGNIVYTFPDYINLYGGKDVTSGREMEKYHIINEFPTIMLIDKQGKIYSSTVPLIYGGGPRNKEIENNIQKFINLIQQALSEPAAKKPIL